MPAARSSNSYLKESRWSHLPNPPLKEFCEKYGVGIADDDYAQAIKAVAEHYTKWQDAVHYFVDHVHVERNNHRLAQKIQNALEEKQA